MIMLNWEKEDSNQNGKEKFFNSPSFCLEKGMVVEQKGHFTNNFGILKL